MVDLRIQPKYYNPAGLECYIGVDDNGKPAIRIIAEPAWTVSLDDAEIFARNILACVQWVRDTKEPGAE